MRIGDVADVAGRDYGERSSRVTILAIDAASLELITNATADGRLPNFGRLLDAGAVMHLATLHPTSAEAVWAAAATGKLPQKNGVRSLGTYRLARHLDVSGRPRAADARGGEAVQLMPEYCYANALMRFGLFVEEPHTSATFRARPFWSILSALNIPVAVAGWPLTQPAPAVLGYLVSDAYPRRVGTSAAIEDSSSVYPAGRAGGTAQTRSTSCRRTTPKPSRRGAAASARRPVASIAWSARLFRHSNARDPHRSRLSAIRASMRSATTTSDMRRHRPLATSPTMSAVVSVLCSKRTTR